MEMQFKKEVYQCLQLWAEEVKNEEHTLEIKLPDAMPDIGSVLGAWGQILIRGKEWRGSGMSVSGGVMTWAVYIPEDGSMPRTVEGWIPFSMRWDFPQAQRDGAILTACQLRSVDGRCLSARKLIMRANISLMAQALEPSEFCVYQPERVPEDVQLLRRSYPLCHQTEAGEKQFTLDEDFALPSDMARSKPMCYRLQPQITDKKIMADKIVFRGLALLQILLRNEEGNMKACSFEIPFSQYAQLDKEYGESAQHQVLPLTTSLELEALEDGRLRMKAGLTGQYVIYDRQMIDLVEDAYSNLFDRYKRQPGIYDSRQSLGLGLALVRAAASAHQGTVLVDHPTDNGTRVTMTLRIQNYTTTFRSEVGIKVVSSADDGRVMLSNVLPASVYEPLK